MDKEKELKIVNLYVNEKFGVRSISKELHFSGPTILSVLHRYGVTRSREEGKQLAADGKYKDLDEKVRHLYLIEKLGIKSVSERLSSNFGLVQRRLKRMGILRSKSEGVKIAYEQGRFRPGGHWTREKNPRWKGGRRIRSDGYVGLLKPEHPRAHKGEVLEHIVVWEEAHQETVPKGWIIHHLNGIRSDNRPENLVAMSRNKHALIGNNLSQDARFKYPRLLDKVQARIRELEAEVADLRALNEGEVYKIKGMLGAR